MEQRLISNQVFRQIQVPTYDTESTTGVVVYANQYSAHEPVPISEPYKGILNSDFGEIGNNILVQLEQKIQGFPNGPWFIDSIDDTIYIHNRKFHEGPAHYFTYQQGNGELLDIEFQTQYITKRLDGTVKSGISPDKVLNTDIITTKFFGDYMVDGEAPEEYKFNMLESAYADYHVGKLSYEDLQAVENMFRRQGVINGTQSDLAKLSERRRESDRLADIESGLRANTEQAYQTYMAEASKYPTNGYKLRANRVFHDREVENILQNQDLTHEVERIMIQVTGGNEERERELMNKMRAAANNGTLEEFMKGYFGSALHALDEAVSNTNPAPYQEIYVDPRKFSGNSQDIANTFTPSGKGNYSEHQYNAFQRKQLKLAQAGLEKLRNDPTVKILDNTSLSKVSQIDSGDGYYPGDEIKVFMRVETVGIVSQYQVLYNYYTRKYGSGPTGSWTDVERRINEAGNQGKRITERKLICNMTCIGNPKLSSSQVVIISNVGKRWSGTWYVKTCTHQLVNGQGYTCRLELVKNLATNQSSVVSLGTGTSELAVASMSNNGSDVVLASDGDIRTKFTQDEITWFYGERSKGKDKEHEAAMLLLLGKDSKSKWLQDNGVIRKRVDTSTSGKASYEYFVDENLKVDREALQTYSAKASQFVKELEESLEKDKE